MTVQDRTNELTDVEAPDQQSPFPRVSRFWVPLADDLPGALTCDVEDYFQVSAFELLTDRSDWPDLECRIPANVDRILNLYSDAGVSGTFFTLGWVAEHFPEVVRRISSAGHEIASHGMEHRRVWDQTSEQFRADVRRSKRLLEDLTGSRILGYRAASWSLDSRTPWAYDVLAEEGYKYSSSIYPISHDHYGLPNAPRQPFYVSQSELLEIPASTAATFNRNLPAAGGGYFRLLPYGLSRWLSRRVRRDLGMPAMFYYHPWELDPQQPRMEGASARARFRHYVNLKRFEPRFVRLLQEFSWDRMDRIYLAGGS